MEPPYLRCCWEVEKSKLCYKNTDIPQFTDRFFFFFFFFFRNSADMRMQPLRPEPQDVNLLLTMIINLTSNFLRDLHALRDPFIARKAEHPQSTEFRV